MPWIHDGLPIMGEDIHSHPIPRPERLWRARKGKDQALSELVFFSLCFGRLFRSKNLELYIYIKK